MTPTWYDILGVEPGATADQIKKAWRAATDKFEPGSGNNTQFRMFNDAADVLLDPERRKAYDAQLADPASSGAPNGSPAGTARAAKPKKISLKKAEPVAAAEPVEATDDPPVTVQPEVRTPVGTLHKVVALGLLPLLAVAAVVVAAVFGIKVHQNSQTADARSEAPAAADRAMTQVLSYDYQHMAADRAAASKLMTTTYRNKQYLPTYKLLEVGKDGKPGPAVTTKTVVTANVLGTAVVDAEPDRVRVLVYVNQVSKKAGKDSTIFQNRVVTTMVKSGNDWLIEDINSY
ncbi:MAG: heat shock protein DnaJ domain protein [Marmoricola sp.]|nr:heat shock protein DnaJ domain protein [Marmoricola sp.]